jgi:hypothetical protein
MEVYFIIWLVACCLSAAVHFLYDKISGETTEQAKKTFSRITTAAALGSLVGFAISFIVLIILGFAGLFGVGRFLEDFIWEGAVVFYFANVSVSAAYLAIKGSF